MIGMAGNRAVGTKGHEHVRTELANPQGQIANYFVEILAMELAVGIVEHDSREIFRMSISVRKTLPQVWKSFRCW